MAENSRVTQLGIEVLAIPEDAPSRVTQMGVEVLYIPKPDDPPPDGAGSSTAVPLMFGW